MSGLRGLVLKQGTLLPGLVQLQLMEEREREGVEEEEEEAVEEEEQGGEAGQQEEQGGEVGEEEEEAGDEEEGEEEEEERRSELGGKVWSGRLRYLPAGVLRGSGTEIAYGVTRQYQRGGGRVCIDYGASRGRSGDRGRGRNPGQRQTLQAPNHTTLGTKIAGTDGTWCAYLGTEKWHGATRDRQYTVCGSWHTTARTS